MQVFPLMFIIRDFEDRYWAQIFLQAYNGSGKAIFQLGRQGVEDYREFVLRNLDKDCVKIVKTVGEGYIIGRGQNHVWIAERISGKRVLIMHF